MKAGKFKVEEINIRQFIVVLFGVLLLACKGSADKFPGYTLAGETGVYEKLISFEHMHGDAGLVGIPAYLTLHPVVNLHMVCATLGDSVVWRSGDGFKDPTIAVTYSNLKGYGALGKAILKAQLGDSLGFIVPAGEVLDHFLQWKAVPGLEPKQWLKVHCKISAKEGKAFDATEEQGAIQSYLALHQWVNVKSSPFYRYTCLKDGIGVPADSGRVLVVKLRGSFLDGRVFDTHFTQLTFEFRLGEEFQVITGLQEGIKLMRKYAKAKFIIPSRYGFGKEGSSTGIVPPDAVLIYDVELLNIK